MIICKNRQLIFCVILTLIMFCCFGVARGARIGTPLTLGNGQQLRLDLPLEAQKMYEIEINLRTDLPQSKVTITLQGVRQNNEIEVLESVSGELGDDGQWQQLSMENVRTAQNFVRWELVLTANVEGRYFWEGLSVARTFDPEHNVQEYWSKKLATQGPFYTGLVVDARGLDVRRGMSPRIYSATGQLIYGGVLASQDFVQERGVVMYGSELSDDLLNQLQVDPDYPYTAPLIVEAVGIADEARTSVYIDDSDTRRILEAMAQYDFFARYAVIFLVD